MKKTFPSLSEFAYATPHKATMPTNNMVRSPYASSGSVHSVRKTLVVVTDIVQRHVFFEVTVNYGVPSIYGTIEAAIESYNAI